MKIIECTPRGDEKRLQGEIFSILHEYFPIISAMEKEIGQNKFIVNKHKDDKMTISLSFGYLKSHKQKENTFEEKIDKISLRIEEPDEALTSEIFIG
jgi:hypothetical protein